MPNQRLISDLEFDPAKMNFAEWIQKIDRERFEELETQADRRRFRESRILKSLDDAILHDDAKQLMTTALRLCAMHAWKRGMSEGEYSRSRRRKSAPHESSGAPARIVPQNIDHSSKVLEVHPGAIASR
jgi:hypothetical protein